MKARVSSVVLICALLLAVESVQAQVLYNDQCFDVDFRVGKWSEWAGQESTPTWSVSPSPGGKSGYSLHGNWVDTVIPSDDLNRCDHITVDFSDDAPTTGQATYLMHFYVSGPSNASAMIGSINQTSTGSNNFQIDRQISADAGVFFARTYSPYSLIDEITYSKDTWYSMAWVVDDLTNSQSAAHLYFAEGLTVGVDDYVGSGNVNGTVIRSFDFIPYVHYYYHQSWDWYFDDLTVNSGQDFIFPEEVVIVPGDATKDGKVDHDDAVVLASNWLTDNASWSMGDFNFDGVVDDIDATILATNFTSSTAVSQTVPEPGFMAFLVVMMVSLLLYSHPHRNP